ncbi:MAG: DUF2384 domain-containing protein [Verrucomicrobia bacterium]|nr:DUF2384 domain-containing protein [Verrucomicrobiota bacterium]MBV9672160.1 DUF2384 domain-containing protein [Verrucomicrobiota bacterium]
MEPLRRESKKAVAEFEDRSDPKVRQKLSGPAVRSFFNIAQIWGLTVDQKRALLGWPATSTLYKYRGNEIGTLSYDTLIRISLVLGIYKALHILYPDSNLADRWIKLPNSNRLFDGQPVIDFLSKAGVDGLYQVRRLLDGRRGGWS